MFASRSLSVHLARGVVGLGSFAAALPLDPSPVLTVGALGRAPWLGLTARTPAARSYA